MVKILILAACIVLASEVNAHIPLCADEIAKWRLAAAQHDRYDKAALTIRANRVIDCLLLHRHVILT